MLVSLHPYRVSWLVACMAVIAAFWLAAAPARAQLTFVSTYSFTDTYTFPYGGLVEGSDGNFYGTTNDGGGSNGTGSGTVFKVTSSGTLTTLVIFTGTNGARPFAGLVQGRDGNFYGTTEYGGVHSISGSGFGTVFMVTPSGTLTTLVKFAFANGSVPKAALVQGSDGDFYGTTYGGGSTGEGYGTIFKVTSSGTLTTLYAFPSTNSNGDNMTAPFRKRL